MSEHRPEYGSEKPNGESEATGSSNADGANPEDAIGMTDGSAEEPLATRDEPADESPAAAELSSEASVSRAADGATATPPEPPDADDGAAAATDDGSVFLAELVRAMQTTAGLERVRIGEDAERRRQAHTGQVRAREASEADRIRELAGEDMKAIEAWTDGETKRIQLERDRRATALHEDLDTSLAEHHSKIDREIEGVETAIATYRDDLDAFFEGFDRETDLILIAQQAAMRPVFPTLEGVAETIAASSADAAEAEPSSAQAPPTGAGDGATSAGTAGTSEPALVGVMDPQAAAEPVESWAAARETSPEPGSAGASDDVNQSGEAREPAEPVAAATGLSHGSAGSLLRSVPVLRPMSWLRRDTNGGDPPNPEGEDRSRA
jgi:hypothetical protein